MIGTLVLLAFGNGRLLTSLGGWGMTPFIEDGGYWWVPVVAPIFGALIGIYIYDSTLRKALIDKSNVVMVPN